MSKRLTFLNICNENQRSLLKESIILYFNITSFIQQRQYELKKLLTIEEYCKSVTSGDLGFHVAQKVFKLDSFFLYSCEGFLLVDHY